MWRGRGTCLREVAHSILSVVAADLPDCRLAQGRHGACMMLSPHLTRHWLC